MEATKCIRRHPRNICMDKQLEETVSSMQRETLQVLVMPYEPSQPAWCWCWSSAGVKSGTGLIGFHSVSLHSHSVCLTVHRWLPLLGRVWTWLWLQKLHWSFPWTLILYHFPRNMNPISFTFVFRTSFFWLGMRHISIRKAASFLLVTEKISVSVEKSWGLWL